MLGITWSHIVGLQGITIHVTAIVHWQTKAIGIIIVALYKDYIIILNRYNYNYYDRKIRHELGQSTMKMHTGLHTTGHTTLHATFASTNVQRWLRT